MFSGHSEVELRSFSTKIGSVSLRLLEQRLKTGLLNPQLVPVALAGRRPASSGGSARCLRHMRSWAGNWHGFGVYSGGF